MCRIVLEEARMDENPQVQEEAPVEALGEELVIEEVSIDGMCGVY